MIPERRVVVKDASELPTSYCQTPGGTIFSTTPGGEFYSAALPGYMLHLLQLHIYMYNVHVCSSIHVHCM